MKAPHRKDANSERETRIRKGKKRTGSRDNNSGAFVVTGEDKTNFMWAAVIRRRREDIFKEKRKKTASKLQQRRLHCSKPLRECGGGDHARKRRPSLLGKESILRMVYFSKQLEIAYEVHPGQGWGFSSA